MTPIHVRSTAIAMRNLRIIVRTMAITCETSFHVTNFNIGPLEVQDEEKNRENRLPVMLYKVSGFLPWPNGKKSYFQKDPPVEPKKTAKKYFVSRDHDELLSPPATLQKGTWNTAN